jgi:hypothetical protein
MASGTELLERITAGRSSFGRLLAPLGSVVDPLARSYWETSVRPTPLPEAPDACLVVGARQVAHYHLTGSQGWASYEALRGAFAQRDHRRAMRGTGRGAKTGVLPRPLVDGDLKVVIRDHDRPIQCAVVWERVYPKRAWVGTLVPGYGADTAFVIAAILNSTLGQALYYQLAHRTGSQAGSKADLRKGILSKIPVPVLAYDEHAFSRVALLSFRLHCLYAAKRDCDLPFEITNVIRDHWRQLLSDLLRLYEYSDDEAHRLFAEVLPATFQDVLGIQMDLYYVPQEPPRKLKLLDSGALDRYEALKERARSGDISPGEGSEFQNFEMLLHWEDRINGPIPCDLHPTPWPGVSDEKAALKAAYRHLSYKHGQRFGAEDPRRLDERIWEVNVYYSPPKGLSAADAAALPTAWRAPGKHAAGTLRIDSITGKVTDQLHEATGAVDSSAR